MTSSTRNERRPFMLAPPPPGLDAREQDQARHNEHRQVENPALLVRGQRDALILRIARPDRDQVLLLREPVHRVQEQLAVTRDAEDRSEEHTSELQSR